MKAKMIVYNNHTGIVNLMNPLFESEGIQVIVARDYTHLVNLLKQELDFRIEIAQMSSEIRRLKTELGLEKFRRSVRSGKNEG